MIMVNTGNGKGKTTAAIGQIVRSLGRGWKVCLIQLFKGKEFYGEQKILARLKNLDFYSFAPKHPYCFPTIKHKTVKGQCRRALSCFEKLSHSNKYQLIVLEEFNIALREGYIQVKDILKVLNKLDSNLNIIITGRGAPKELIKRSDIATEMTELKHHFNKGKTAMKGIEF